MAGGVHGRVVHGRVVHGRGAYVVGGMHGRGGMRAGDMVTEAGGTHPTGVHSCYMRNVATNGQYFTQ